MLKRRPNRIGPLVGLLFALLLNGAPFLGIASASSWDEVSGGAHSYQSLGSDFYIPVPIKKIEGARLVLFNYAAAEKLGLDVPRDPRALEKLILDRFAVMIADDASAERHLMATYYMDSGSKRPGDAIGDGRAAWTGELLRKLPDGRSAAIDFVIKGVGQTALAWTNHTEPTHKDGLQAMQEGVHSFIVSQANVLNGMDSTIDLAVIEIPQLKKNKYTGAMEKASITLRVGNQTRLAHFAYFQDDPAKFKRVADYIVNRDVGRAFDSPVSATVVNTYLNNFAMNIAVEEARYMDLHAVHGSPTIGNRTTTGSTIDMGTFRYLDAHHGQYKYLFNRYNLDGQYNAMARYIFRLTGYMRAANYFASTIPTDKELKALFVTSLRDELSRLWLQRLGLSAGQIQKITPGTRNKFLDALWVIVHKTASVQKNISSQRITPALFELRRIMPGLASLLLADHINEQKLLELFITDREWGTLTELKLAGTPAVEKKRLARMFESAMNFIFQRLNQPKDEPTPVEKKYPLLTSLLEATKTVLLELKLSEEDKQAIVSRAGAVNGGTREVPNADFFVRDEERVINAIQTTDNSQFDFSKESAIAVEISKKLVDQTSERSFKSVPYQLLELTNESRAPEVLEHDQTCEQALLGNVQ